MWTRSASNGWMMTCDDLSVGGDAGSMWRLVWYEG